VVVNEIVEAFILSGFAYIKPGCMHRFSEHKELIDYITLGPKLYNVLVKASEIGEKVASGKIGAPSAGIGRLLSDAIKAIGGRLTKNRVFYDAIVSLTITAIAASHASTVHKREISESRIEKSLRLFLASSTGKDSSALVHITRTIGPTKYVSLFNKADYTRTRVEMEDISLYEIFYTLSPISISLKALVEFTPIVNTIKNIKKYYEKLRDVNNALVSAYISELLDLEKPPLWAKKDLEYILSEGAMVSKTSAKKLFEIDRRMRKEKIEYNELLPILTTASAISLILKYIA